MRIKKRTSKLIYQNPILSLTCADPNKALITNGLTLFSTVTMESSVNGSDNNMCIQPLAWNS